MNLFLKQVLIVGVSLILFSRIAGADSLSDARQAYLNNQNQIAARLLLPLAEAGNAEAQYMLGELYHYGRSVRVNSDESLKWLRLSAKQSYDFAQATLGDIYFIGEIVPQDYVEAEKWYGLAANHGNAYAQYRLGKMYLKGKGVSQNYKEALKWYRMAAEEGPNKKGYVDAQVALVEWYHPFIGVGEYDFSEGMKWSFLAANQGSAWAQIHLGAIYEKGEETVHKNYREAVKWYRLAAEQGDSVGQNSLGSMYEEGKGLPQDYVLAYMWIREGLIK